MFALLAMAGDFGGAFGPGLVGNVTQRANDDLQTGMLAGCIFPLILLIFLVLMKHLVPTFSSPTFSSGSRK